MKVSLIATVLNEGDNLHRLLQSIVEQTRPPDEVVFVDGGSSDNTREILAGYADRLPLRVIVESGANISRGRNLAVQNATHDLIAVTDAGVRLESTWLERLIRPFEQDAQTEMVGGFFHAETFNTFEISMGATVLPLADEIDPQGFLPSSRSVAFKKALFLAIGGYPEWLDYCEDLILDLCMKQRAKKFVFVADAIAHFRPRGNFRAFYKQYYLYARGDGKADLWRKRHAIRYVTYLVGVPLILALGAFVHPLLWGLFVVGGVIYCKRPYQRLAHLQKTAPPLKGLALLWALLLIPLIRVVGDVAKMHGYPIGWRWRIENRPPRWDLFI